MKSSVAAVLAAVAGVHAWSGANNVTYTTEVVTALTTYCPEATVLTHAGSTYTITSVRSNYAMSRHLLAYERSPERGKS